MVIPTGHKRSFQRNKADRELGSRKQASKAFKPADHVAWHGDYLGVVKEIDAHARVLIVGRPNASYDPRELKLAPPAAQAS